MIAEITGKMIAYNGKDVRRINHALKVLAFAHLIAEKENCGSETVRTVCCAAALHDIGIHNAERKYKSTAGPYQEKEGVPVAEELLRDSGMEQAMKERVLFLIGHHHTYAMIDGIDFQILAEADFIVNAFEDEMGSDAVISVKNKIFRTATGIALLDGMYL